MNHFSSAQEKALPSPWKWLNEPENWHFNEKQQLILQAPPMADFFNDPTGEKKTSSAPFLYMELPGDFVAITRVAIDMRSEYDSGCIMVMLNQDFWAKLCYEYIHKRPTIVSVVTKEDSDDCVSLAIEEKRPYLRVAKKGNCFAFHYSLDREEWTMVRYFSLKGGEGLKVGVVAQSPTGEGCQVNFSFFETLDNRRANIKQV